MFGKMTRKIYLNTVMDKIEFFLVVIAVVLLKAFKMLLSGAPWWLSQPMSDF